MRTFLYPFIAAIALLSAPLVAASGVGVDATYDEMQDETCDQSDWEYSDEYHNPNSSSYHSADGSVESCESSFTTAGVTAHDDDGELAHADLGGADSSRESENQSYTYSYRDSEYRTGSSTHEGAYSDSSESWRGVTLRVAGEESRVGSACEDSYTSRDSWRSSYSQDGESYQTGSYGTWDSERTSGCMTGYKGEVAGRSVGAGYETPCDDEWTSTHHGHNHPESTNNFAHGWGERTNDYSCGSGVAASGGGEEAAAGIRSDCDGTGDSYSEWWYNETSGEYEDYYESHDTDTCTYGATASGPTGTSARAGYQFVSGYDCYSSGDNWTCMEHAMSGAVGGEATWSQSPFGGGSILNLWIPLP